MFCQYKSYSASISDILPIGVTFCNMFCQNYLQFNGQFWYFVLFCRSALLCRFNIPTVNTFKMHIAKQLGPKVSLGDPSKMTVTSLFNSSKRSNCNNNRNFHLCHKSAKNKQRFNQMREKSTHTGRICQAAYCWNPILSPSQIILQITRVRNMLSIALPNFRYVCIFTYLLAKFHTW